MGKLSTHVLDTANGCPAAGMRVVLLRLGADDRAAEIKSVPLDADGRAGGPLLEGAALRPGRYRLVFAVVGVRISAQR